MDQSLNAIKIDGIISIIGFLGGEAEKHPSFLDALTHTCTVRGFFGWEQISFEEMVGAIRVPFIDLGFQDENAMLTLDFRTELFRQTR